MVSWKDLTSPSGWNCTLGVLTNQTMHHLTFLQSTGLEDRNGVEMFQGDNVALYPDTEWMMTVIVQTEGRLELAWDNGPKGIAIDSGNHHLRLSSIRPDYYQVVGNVYQDSHLLEE